MKKVLLTGATGYLGAWITKYLVQSAYSVVATARSADRIEWMKRNHPSLAHSIQWEVIEDVQQDGAFDAVLKNNPDITTVIHAASPFYIPKDDPMGEMVAPTINGVKNILKATKRFAPQVQRIVLTSSYATMADARQYNSSFTVSESSWNSMTWADVPRQQESREKGDFISTVRAYQAAKQLAEEEFWRFIDHEKPNFDGIALCPVLVYGPLAQRVDGPDTFNFSVENIYSLLHSHPGRLKEERGYTVFVDVRDVARAHILAIERPASPRRWLLAAEYDHPQMILDIINNNFPDIKGRIATGTPVSDAEHAKNISTYPVIDDKLTRKVLGFQYRSLKESIIDTVKTMIELDRKWGN